MARRVQILVLVGLGIVVLVIYLIYRQRETEVAGEEVLAPSEPTLADVAMAAGLGVLGSLVGGLVGAGVSVWEAVEETYTVDGGPVAGVTPGYGYWPPGLFV